MKERAFSDLLAVDLPAATHARDPAQRTAWVDGLDYFCALVQGLSESFGTHSALVAEVEPGGGIRPLAYWTQGSSSTTLDHALADAVGADVLDSSGTALPDPISGRVPHGPDGHSHEASSYLATPLVDASGRVVGFVAVIDREGRDWNSSEAATMQLVGRRTATEIARLRDQRLLQEARAAAESTERAHAERLAQLGHELRTPLNGILGHAQLLARDPTLDARQLMSVRTMHECGERLLRLLDDFDNPPLAHTERGNLQLSTTATLARSSGARAAVAEAGRRTLPPELRARLILVCRRGDIVELNRCLDDLDRRGERSPLLTELHALARAFDLKAVRERLHADEAEGS